MRIRFWGVRGSLPVPGPRTERYGGNTSCVEVSSAAGTRIIIDAGTGIRRLGKELMRGEFESGKGAAHLLISHTHWDHIQGLPFFAPFYRAGNKLFVYARQRDDQNLRSVLSLQVDSPFFPVPFHKARADVAFRELHDGAHFEINDVVVSCARLNHPYIATAYALSADGAKVAYIADTAPFSDILFGQEFIAGPPSPHSLLSKTTTRPCGPCATRWFACARVQTWSSTTPCSRPRSTAKHPIMATRGPRMRSKSVAMRAPGHWRCIITRRIVRTLK